MTAGYVYAVNSPECPHLVKIGLSTNPESRLKQLQTGNPHRLELIWTFPCADMSAAEDAFHRTFERFRKVGEWFDLAPNDSPEHIGLFLTFVAARHLAEDSDIREMVAGIEEFITDPTGFPASSETWNGFTETERAEVAACVATIRSLTLADIGCAA